MLLKSAYATVSLWPVLLSHWAWTGRQSGGPPPPPSGPTPTQLLALAYVAKLLGSTSFLLQRVGGERRHENEWDGMKTQSTVHPAPKAHPACHGQVLFENSFWNKWSQWETRPGSTCQGKEAFRSLFLWNGEFLRMCALKTSNLEATIFRWMVPCYYGNFN